MEKIAARFSVVLISTYELGHQPFGLASPAAWLRSAGADVSCMDLAVQELREPEVCAADLIAVYVPMHTATRLASALMTRFRKLNPDAHICLFGLYAPMNEEFLRGLGADTIIGGEFERPLTSLAERLAAGKAARSDQADQADQAGQADQADQADQARRADGVDAAGGGHPSLPGPEPVVSLDRLEFKVPDRRSLPLLAEYAYLSLPDGTQRVVGYTEATRGCKHLCRHCPIVPVYNGRFRVVGRDVVLADVDAQVSAGAQHITFGDPDFFNGPAHARAIVTALHERHPALTYDVTIKVEHLLKHVAYLPVLRDTGCLFVTSAVESVDDRILANFDKRHSRQDFVQVAKLFGELGVALNPTFVTFTPWTTPENYFDLLALIAELGLVNSVAPIQYAIRLLIPRGSRLLELPEVQNLVGEFDEASLAYPWVHPDPRVDELYERVMAEVKGGMRTQADRLETFTRIWRVARGACPDGDAPVEPPIAREVTLKPVPRLSEPWYCCAEPTEEQLSPSV